MTRVRIRSRHGSSWSQLFDGVGVPKAIGRVVKLAARLIVGSKRRARGGSRGRNWSAAYYAHGDGSRGTSPGYQTAASHESAEGRIEYTVPRCEATHQKFHIGTVGRTAFDR